jgi:chorismate mutase
MTQLSNPHTGPMGVRPPQRGTPSVEAGRHRLDQIDTTIRTLIAVRREVSHQVQSMRAAHGEARLAPGRENEIIAAYAAGLGPAGVDIALAILTACRGRIMLPDDF